MKNKCNLMFTILILFFFTSCEKDNSVSEDLQSKQEIEYSVSEKDIVNLINSYYSEDASLSGTISSHSIKNSTKPQIKNISSLSKTKSNTIQSSATGKKSRSVNSEDLLYSVELENNKTFLIAADKRAYDVYAILDFPFSFEDENNDLSDGFISWIENICFDIDFQKNNSSTINELWSSEPKSSLVTHTATTNEPLFYIPNKCKVNWGQSAPYNVFTPKINGQNTLTGCVAVAAAQALTVVWDKNIKTFNNYPLATSWESIINKPSLYQNDGSVELIDIAMLMLNIGQNSGMDYGLNASGTKTHYAINLIKRASNNTIKVNEDWNKIYETLVSENGITILSAFSERRHPTMFRSTSYGGGHAMVIDGFTWRKGGVYLHVNFGWRGSGNGYFLNFSKLNLERFKDSNWSNETSNQYPYNNTVYNLTRN